MLGVLRSLEEVGAPFQHLHNEVDDVEEKLVDLEAFVNITEVERKREQGVDHDEKLYPKERSIGCICTDYFLHFEFLG